MLKDCLAILFLNKHVPAGRLDAVEEGCQGRAKGRNMSLREPLSGTRFSALDRACLAQLKHTLHNVDLRSSQQHCVECKCGNQSPGQIEGGIQCGWEHACRQARCS